MKNWLFLVLLGVLAIIAGIVALAFPLPASLTVNAFVGASLLIAGALGAFSAFSALAGSDRIWGMLLGLATLALGVLLLSRPAEGLAAITLLFAIGFLASGIFKILLGWRMPANMPRWLVVLSGVLTLGLALIILTGFPASAAVVPGLLLAVELLSYGWGLVFIGLGLRRIGR